MANKHKAFRGDTELKRGDRLVTRRFGNRVTFAYVADDGRIATQEAGSLPVLRPADKFHHVRVELEPADTKSDYLAIAYIMAGSCYGRSHDRITAINMCRVEALKFAKPFGGFKPDATLTVNVLDVTGHGQVTWDERGVHGDDVNKAIGKAEIVRLNPHKRYPQ